MEDMIASRIAKQLLEENPNLKNVHSKTSMKKLLEQEAKRQLEQGGTYKEPKVSIIKQHEIMPVTASNLPHLHKNPAI